MNHAHRPIGHGAAHRAGLLRIDAAGLVDGAGTSVRGASVLLEVSPGTRPRLLAAGRAADVLTHPAATRADTTVISRPSSVLLPGLVNAHTHLDLTHIGPQPHDPAAGFVPWVDMIRSRRHTDETAIAASVRRGIELCLAGGCVAIGDIGGAPAGRLSLAPWRTLRDSGVGGVSFLEYFGIGASLEPRSAGLTRLVDEVAGEAGDAAAKGQAQLGLQPHAPNTVALSLYRLSIALAERLPGSRLCTHLAETIEEREFITRGTGPQRELLERFGLWTNAVMDELGRGEHPVEHLAGVLQSAQERLA
ncbi:MAG: amidohydrolase family protein, partial [Phycisphaerales bacterium]|nr:amidohydrolase family protein [Phycisphaerales bacterium]